MIINQFGSYVFSNINASDQWRTERPAVTERIGGAVGAFDFFGETANPVAPLIVRKTFLLKASTYAGMDFDTLRESTIGKERDKLYILTRSGDYRWAWAKCTSLAANEQAGNWLTVPVEIEFTCPEGVWYGQTSERSASRTGTGFVSLDNQGNDNALLRVAVAAGATNVTVNVYHPTNPGLPGICSWTWTGTTAGSGLQVNARAYSCTNDNVDAYSGLSVGSGQVAWAWLAPGHSTGASVGMSGSAQVTFYWYDTYV